MDQKPRMTAPQYMCLKRGSQCSCYRPPPHEKHCVFWPQSALRTHQKQGQLQPSCSQRDGSPGWTARTQSSPRTCWRQVISQMCSRWGNPGEHWSLVTDLEGPSQATVLTFFFFSRTMISNMGATGHSSFFNQLKLNKMLGLFPRFPIQWRMCSPWQKVLLDGAERNALRGEFKEPLSDEVYKTSKKKKDSNFLTLVGFLPQCNPLWLGCLGSLPQPGGNCLLPEHVPGKSLTVPLDTKWKISKWSLQKRHRIMYTCNW